METLKSKFSGDCLLVIVPDVLSDIVKKGEVTERYYNPGELFKNVHILLLNDDKPDITQVQKMVGGAKLFIHNLPCPRFSVTIGWNPQFLKIWARKGISLAKKVKPQLIRCHGNDINTWLAAEIKNELHIPYIISMHINPDQDVRATLSWNNNFKQKLKMFLTKPIESIGLKNADAVICVYKFIIPYAQRLRAQRVEVIYNAVNPSNLEVKTNYNLNSPPHGVVVGRQFEEKDPTPLIAAMAEIPEVKITFIGDGPFHEKLKEQAANLKIVERCLFLKSKSNDELCGELKDFDFFVSINNYGGVSKVELEAAHVGLPIITNSHPLEIEPEVLGANCLVVDGSIGSYRMALERFLKDENLRSDMGQGVRESAVSLTPLKMELKLVELYGEFIGRKNG